MTASELAKAAWAVPFRPFELVTGDGQRFRVPTSDHFSIGPAKRLATVWFDDDSHSILDVDLITHLTFLTGRAPRRNARDGSLRGWRSSRVCSLGRIVAA